MTLHELYHEHPEWRHLPLAVYQSDGELDYIGTVYLSPDENEPAIVFAGN